MFLVILNIYAVSSLLHFLYYFLVIFANFYSCKPICTQICQFSPPLWMIKTFFTMYKFRDYLYMRRWYVHFWKKNIPTLPFYCRVYCGMIVIYNYKSKVSPKIWHRLRYINVFVSSFSPSYNAFWKALPGNYFISITEGQGQFVI